MTLLLKFSSAFYPLFVISQHSVLRRPQSVPLVCSIKFHVHIGLHVKLLLMPPKYSNELLISNILISRLQYVPFQTAYERTKMSK